MFRECKLTLASAPARLHWKGNLSPSSLVLPPSLKKKKSYIISGSSSVCRRNMSGRSKQMEWGMVDGVAATVPSILLWGEGISRDDGSSRKNRDETL